MVLPSSDFWLSLTSPLVNSYAIPLLLLDRQHWWGKLSHNVGGVLISLGLGITHFRQSKMLDHGRSCPHIWIFSINVLFPKPSAQPWQSLSPINLVPEISLFCKPPSLRADHGVLFDDYSGHEVIA